jgi:phage I-like protein
MNSIKRIINALRRTLGTASLQAANDEEICAANALGGEGVFELQQQESLFIPYGNYPHKVGLQKFDAASGAQLVTAFNSIIGKISRIFSPGVPIYRGHPDVPGRPDSDPSAPAVGWVDGITAENDGVRLGVKWNADGMEDIERARFRFYSPNWALRAVSGGLQPVRLLSVGLTNNPRIPVPAIANDETTTKENTTMIPQWIIDMLMAAGLIEAGASEDSIKTGMEKACAAINRLQTAEMLEREAGELRQRCQIANDQIAALTGERDTATARVTELETQLTAANDARNAERSARITAELSPLVGNGRVLEAERADLLAELTAANDETLATRLGELAARGPQLKTTSQIGDMSGARGRLSAENDAVARQNQIREAVTAELELVKAENDGIAPGAAYDLAFQRATKKHPQIFGSAKAAA